MRDAPRTPGRRRAEPSWWPPAPRPNHEAYGVTIAVVDAAGVLLALERLDGARLHTPGGRDPQGPHGRDRAHCPTADLQRAVAADPALLAFPGRLPLAGGMPLLHAHEVLGGIGSSGGEPEDDIRVCRAALDALAKRCPG